MKKFGYREVQSESLCLSCLNTPELPSCKSDNIKQKNRINKPEYVIECSNYTEDPLYNPLYKGGKHV